MRNFPISFLNAFGPAPETALPDSCWLVCPKIFVEIKAIASEFINHKSHFVLIMRDWFVSIDFRDEVRSGNLGLTHGHVAHLWTIEVHAIANGIHSFAANDAHRRVDVYVAIVICDPHV